MFLRLWQIASFLLIIITNNQAKWFVRCSVQLSSDPTLRAGSSGHRIRVSQGCLEVMQGGAGVEGNLPGIYIYLAVGALASFESP